MALPPRGIRNNNPGNIRVGEDWDGIAEKDEIPDWMPNETEFVVFIHPFFGLRALAKLLNAYINRHELDTVDKIIARYAPSSENKTNKYIEYVKDYIGEDPDLYEHDDLVSLIEAIVLYENGIKKFPYSYVLLDAAMLSAGLIFDLWINKEGWINE